ncbi:zinc finger protein 99-like [Culicoides brevitarsis]|uniref:zinc finger protein 99-like n=1 Tax=Culicoides brevitarsis TaxID=469753 RepID=UPI00307BF784
MHDKQEINLLLEVDPVTGLLKNYKIIKNLKDQIKKSKISLVKSDEDDSERIANCDCCSNPYEIFLYQLENEAKEELEPISDVIEVKEEQIFVEPIVPLPAKTKLKSKKLKKNPTKNELKPEIDPKILEIAQNSAKRKAGRPKKGEIVIPQRILAKKVYAKNENGFYKCDKCQTEYDKLRPFKLHFHCCNGTNLGRYTTTETPGCGYCGKLYTNWLTARSHEKMKHEAAITYTCEICGYTTKHKYSFTNHLYIHEPKKQFMCDLCQYRCSSRHGMKQHMQMIHLKIGIHVCEVCAKIFPNSEALKSHLAYQHSEERNFPCPNCDKAFKTKINLNSHIQRIHIPTELKEKFQCERCDFFSYCGKSFKAHQAIHVDTEDCPYKCQICQRGFVSKHRFKEHEKSHSDERPYQCDYCEKAFRRKADCKVHMRYHTGEKPYECEICKQRYSDRGCYRSHLIAHEKQLGIVLDKSVKKFMEKPIVLSIDNKNCAKMHEKQEINLLLEFDSVTGALKKCKIIENLKDEIKTNKISLINIENEPDERLGSCNICSNSYQIVLFQVNHEPEEVQTTKIEPLEEFPVAEIKTEVFVEPVQLFPTEDFDDKSHFETEEVEEKHDFNDKPQRRPLTKDIKVAEDGSVKCPYCQSEFRNKLALSGHLKFCNPNTVGRYTKGTKPTCSYCGKTFSQWGTARTHEKKIHEGRIQFTCEVCGYNTTNKDSFENHQLRDHKEEQKHVVCDICGYRCSNKNSIRAHIKFVHLKVDTVTCDLCGKVFQSDSRLAIHRSYAHNDVKNFSCSNCDKMFKTKRCLLNHNYKMHTPTELKKKYSCDHCEYTSFNKFSYKQHLGRHMDDEEKQFQCSVCQKTFVSIYRLKDHEVTHLEERKFRCLFCEKGFKRKADLKIHTRHHTGEKPYECEICKQRYADRGCYRSHIIAHEKQLGIVLDKSVKRFVEKKD